MKTLILKLWPYFLIVLLLIAVTYFAKVAIQEKRDKQRIVVDMAISNSPVKTFTAKNGLKATKTDVMEFKVPEIKKIYPALVKDAENVRISPGNLQNITEIGTCLSQAVTVKTRDSIVYDTVHVKVFNYQDKWTTICGVIGDSSKVRIESRDSLQTFMHKGDRIKPWLWVLSRRKLQQTIINTNPHIQITYQKILKIER